MGNCVYMNVCAVIEVVERTVGAEAWQTAKRIKNRSTTKAVSQGCLSHKSPLDKLPLATHLLLPTTTQYL